MELSLIITIIIAIIIIYLFIKFIALPILRLVLGIIVFLLLIYIVQRLFGFQINQLLAPFGISFNLNGWELNLNYWLLEPINRFIDQIKSFFRYLMENLSKSIGK